LALRGLKAGCFGGRPKDVAAEEKEKSDQLKADHDKGCGKLL
jgi:hypothetical protein